MEILTILIIIVLLITFIVWQTKRYIRMKSTPKTESETIVVNGFGQNYTVVIDNASRKRQSDKRKEDLKQIWIGSNEVESIRDDGYKIYKTNWVTSIESDALGFYGLKWYSNDGSYCVVHVSDASQEYNLALINVAKNKILYRLKFDRIHRCRVTNSGIVVCEDWGGHDKVSTIIYIVDLNGNVILQKRHNSGLGDVFEFTDNENQFKYSLNNTHKIYTIDL